MIRTITFCLLPLLLLATGATVPPKDDRYYEMRIYYAAPGKLEDLQARFRNHTTNFLRSTA
jgi:hypothetical protein